MERGEFSNSEYWPTLHENVNSSLFLLFTISPLHISETEAA